MKLNHNLQPGIFRIMLVFGIVSNLILAQPQHGQNPPKIPDSQQIEQMVTVMAQKLALSESQKTQILELHFSHFDEIRTIHEKSNSDRNMNREQMKTLRDNFESQIKTLLNEDQIVKFEKFLKEHGPGSEKSDRPRPDKNRKRSKK